MNKKIWIVISIVIAVTIGIGVFFCFRNVSNSPNESNYETNKTASNNTANKNNTNDTNATEINQGIAEAEKNTTPIEEQIATYTTKIYSSDSARQNNISITCSTLNNTIVKKGETFSFCSTVGQATSSKGYQEADIFDKDGNKKKGLGGGNCQISTTLYNAVLTVPTLVVTERHAHSNYVPYIEKGKDSAVAYGSYDLKFRNDSGNDIKIVASSDGSSVTTTLFSIK